MKEITKRELKNILRDWQFLLQRMEELREKSKAHCYSITPSYSCTGGGACGVVSSKVERYYLVQARIEEELRELEDKILHTSTAIAKARLSNKEKTVIESMMIGRSIASFAKENNIYISNAYKIRDRAVGKIFNSFV